MSEESLRSLIRLLAPLSTLRQDLEQSIHLEHYHGTGDTVTRIYEGLRNATARALDDPYLDALQINVPADASDREKVSLTLLMAGQLLSFLESQVGMVASVGGGQATKIQTAPNITINASNTDPQTTGRIMDIVDRSLGKGQEEEKE